jgi:hypothetical protein
MIAFIGLVAWQFTDRGHSRLTLVVSLLLLIGDGHRPETMVTCRWCLTSRHILPGRGPAALGHLLASALTIMRFDITRYWTRCRPRRPLFWLPVVMLFGLH